MSIFYSKCTHHRIQRMVHLLSEQIQLNQTNGRNHRSNTYCNIDKRLYLYFDNNHRPISLEYHNLVSEFTLEKISPDDIEIIIPEYDKLTNFLSNHQQPFMLQYDCYCYGGIAVRQCNVFDERNSFLFELVDTLKLKRDINAIDIT